MRCGKSLQGAVDMGRRSRAEIRLTVLQLTVVKWLAAGKRSDQTAEILGITCKAVDAHTTRAMDAMGASTRAGLVAMALRSKIIK